MKKKTAYAVFTNTDSGLDIIVKGNFGEDEASAIVWAMKNSEDRIYADKDDEIGTLKYPNGLSVKKIQY